MQKKHAEKTTGKFKQEILSKFPIYKKDKELNSVVKVAKIQKNQTLPLLNAPQINVTLIERVLNQYSSERETEMQR